MLLQPTQSNVVNFVLGISPSTNPYRATANLLTEFIQPCPLPRWSQYIEHLFGLIYLIDVFIAGYIIHLRLKRTKFYFMRFNTLGLIKLDRGFHCTTSYMVHGAVAVVDLVFRDLVFAGRVDQASSNLITGLKSTLLLCNSWAFLWMCICHCALMKWGPIGNSNQTSYTMPYNMARILNLYFLLMLIWIIVPIWWSFSHLTMEYIFARDWINHVIHQLLHAARKYSPTTYHPLEILKKLTALQPALARLPFIVQYTRLGSIFYLINCLVLILTYLPFLTLIMGNLRKMRTRGILAQKQKQVLMQGLLHTGMGLIKLPMIVYMLHFPGDTFIYDPKFWIVLRIGVHGSMAITETVALYLLWCTMNTSDVIPTRNHFSVLKGTHIKEEI